MPLRALLLIAFILISAPVCFIRPFYGIVLWIVIAFLNPQSYTWSVTAIPWAAVVALPTMAGMLLFNRDFGRLASPRFALLLVLWLWFTITTVVSTATPALAHHAAETWERWNFVSKVLLMSACTIPIVNSFQRLRYLVITIAACFGFYILKSLPFVILTGGEFRLYGPELSMIADNNDFGLALNMTLPLYYFLARSEPNWWAKRFYGFMFVITIPAILFTYSRGALLGLAVVLTMMLLQSRRRFALLGVMALAAIIAIYFAPQAWKERMNPTSAEVLDASAQSRLDAWAYARALAADYPIAGGGFATFTPELYVRYAPEQLRNIYGPHSIYFQILAEHGYVGLSLYLILVISCLLKTRQLRRTARARGDDTMANYASMFQFSMLAFLAGGTFLGRAYFDYYFTIVACVIVLEKVARDRWAEPGVTKASVPAQQSRPYVAPGQPFRPEPFGGGTGSQRPVARPVR